MFDRHLPRLHQHRRLLLDLPEAEERERPQDPVREPVSSLRDQRAQDLPPHDRDDAQTRSGRIFAPDSQPEGLGEDPHQHQLHEEVDRGTAARLIRHLIGEVHRVPQTPVHEDHPRHVRNHHRGVQQPPLPRHLVLVRECAFPQQNRLG